MGLKYYDLAFTDAVHAAQYRNGSGHVFSKEKIGNPGRESLGEPEIAFIASRDSFYMATVGSTGWPYVQHRGGPAGFLKARDANTLIMPDFRGNRQYISLGNFTDNDRVSLFFMDYARQGRLKILARASVIEIGEDKPLLANLGAEDYKAKIERAIQFSVEAFEWNCPQHITPRYTENELEPVTAVLIKRIAELEIELEKAKSP